MAAVSKINSNVVGTAYAEESSIGTLPGTPVWRSLLPNTMTDFGGQITKTARAPITDDRMRRKGQTTDLQAAGSMNHDLVQEGLQDLMQGFFFADFRKKAEVGGAGEITSVANADSSYNADSGLDVFEAGDLVFVKGCTNSANNGLKTVATAAAGKITVAETLVNEVSPPSDVTIVAVGFQFSTGDAAIDMTGDLPQLTASVKDMTEFGLIPGEFMFIGDDAASAYQFTGGQYAVSAVPAAGGADYVTGDKVAVSGGTASEAAVFEVTAVDGAVTALTLVTAGVYSGIPSNPAATTTDSAAGAGCTLTVTWAEFGGNYGFARVRSVADAGSYIVLDKTQDTFAEDTGAGKTIRVFFGRVLKNETGTNVVRRTYNIERTLGASDDSAPGQVQSEYLVGAVPNEVTFNIPTADIAKLDMAFMALDSERRTGVVGVKSGTRLGGDEEEAFNTSSNMPRVSVSLVSDTDAAPAPLYAFAQEITLMVKNNVSIDKAVGVLGGFDASYGNFDISGNFTVYFADVAAVDAVQNNSDVTVDMHMVKDNAGISFDIPLISLGDGRLNITLNQPITLPLSYDAAKGDAAVAGMDHVLLMIFWDYLPDLAAA